MYMCGWDRSFAAGGNWPAAQGDMAAGDSVTAARPRRIVFAWRREEAEESLRDRKYELKSAPRCTLTTPGPATYCAACVRSQWD